MNKKGKLSLILKIFLAILICIVIGYFILKYKDNNHSQVPIAVELPSNSMIGRSTTTSNGKEISFEKVSLHTEWRLNDSFDYSTYKGIFHNQNEFERVWKFMINTYDDGSWAAYLNKKHDNQPVMPKIDFNKFSVIWYADKGSNASFTTLKKVLEYDNDIQVNVIPYFSDFGSQHLNLWLIPKTNKDIRFVETPEYDQNQ